MSKPVYIDEAMIMETLRNQIKYAILSGQIPEHVLKEFLDRKKNSPYPPYNDDELDQ